MEMATLMNLLKEKDYCLIEINLQEVTAYAS